MNKISFFLITFLFASRLFAQAEPPKYMQAASQFKKFYNSNKPDSIFARFSPELKTALPGEQFITSTSQLKLQLGSLLKTEFYKYEAPLGVYKATFEHAVFLLNIALNANDQFTGLQLSPYLDKEDPAVTESPVLVKTLAGAISGTLAVPKNATGKIPIAIIIAAAGSVDRDGNGGNLAANDYKLLAIALGKNGIASLRYDKRRVGQSTSTGQEKDLRFDDYFDDVFDLMDMLNKDTRFSKIILIGHGQGSLVGIIAANDDRVNSLISLEGASESADKVLTAQINRDYPKYIADGVKSVLDSIRRGKVNTHVDPVLYPVLRPNIQMFFLNWWRFDPVAEIKKLKKPVLLVQGTTDLEVDVTNADKLKKSKTTEIALITGMNYALKDAPLDKDKNKATYTNPDLPLKPELVTAIVDFIHKLP
jgi:pimeloyl-ACP methyl ester carboxylesterase